MTPLTRTYKEILNRIEKVGTHDILGVQVNDLAVYLDYKHAKALLKDGVTKEEWDKDKKPFTREAVIAEIADYMPFAWEKANDCRGISASRSILHMDGWTWLLNDGLFEKQRSIPYEHYGKEKLICICEALGLDWKQWDDGIRTNSA